MLAGSGRARRRLSGRVRLHLADARLFVPPNPPYDLVVTHFFLDCLTSEEVAGLAARLRESVTPSACWLISEFAVPRGWFGWLIARPIISGLYFAFGLLTGLSVRRLPNHRAALMKAGFRLTRHREWLAGLLVSEFWTLQHRTQIPLAANKVVAVLRWDDQPVPRSSSMTFEATNS